MITDYEDVLLFFSELKNDTIVPLLLLLLEAVVVVLIFVYVYAYALIGYLYTQKCGYVCMCRLYT